MKFRTTQKDTDQVLTEQTAELIAELINNFRVAQHMIDSALEEDSTLDLDYWRADRIAAECDLDRLGIRTATLTQASVDWANRIFEKKGIIGIDWEVK